MPGVVGSLLLIIVGAVARYAYSDSVVSWTVGDNVQSLEVDTVGMIILLAGAVGLVLSVFWAFSSGGGDDEVEPTVVVKRKKKT